MKVVLVSMPFHSLEVPSSAFGVLRPALLDRGHEVQECYAGLWFAEMLADRLGLRVRDYERIANQFEHATGDWIFAGAVSGRSGHGNDFFVPYLRERGIDPDHALAMQDLAPSFAALAAERVLALAPDVVACTTTFMQNVPSLALAGELKARRPDVPVLFGGGNCDGVQGAALLRHHEVVDYVVSGEGEQSLPDLVEVVAGTRHPREVGGLHWRDPVGLVVSNPAAPLVSMATAPTPSYQSYFDGLDASPLRAQISPKVVLEAARGCWWGQKHHCTFCGLNGTSMTFRSKPAEVLLEQLGDLVTRHRCLDVVMVDNIMDNAYTREFLPRLAERGWDLRLHWEVKANLSQQDIDTFRAAGVFQIQPGIENLSTRVLRLMRKGVTGPQNLQVLRDAEAAGLTVTWNLLFGFPGETAADYAPLLAQWERLVHLQPAGAAERLLLERFSPYFDDPSLGFDHRRPAEIYRHIYDLPESALDDLVYLFDAPPAGVDAAIEAQLRELVAVWERRYADSSLEAVPVEDRTLIRDERVGLPPREYLLDPGPARVLAALTRPRRLAALAGDETLGLDAPALDAALRTLDDLGLVYTEDDVRVALPLPAGHRTWTP